MTQKVGVSVAKLAEETGLSRQTVKRALDRAGARRKQVGRSVLYDVDDVAAVLGFETHPQAPENEPVRVSPRVAEFLEPFVAEES